MIYALRLATCYLLWVPSRWGWHAPWCPCRGDNKARRAEV